MPKINRGRAFGYEAAVAERMEYERQRRRWSLQDLATRMTDAGCPINQSAIHKIERGEPRRRITVDELGALAVVFGTPIEELIVPMAIVADARVRQLWDEWRAAQSARIAANQRVRDLERALRDVSAHPLAQPAIREEINRRLRDDDPEGAHLCSAPLRGSGNG